jgi:hypothetical protein
VEEVLLCNLRRKFKMELCRKVRMGASRTTVRLCERRPFVEAMTEPKRADCVRHSIDRGIPGQTAGGDSEREANATVASPIITMARPWQ